MLLAGAMPTSWLWTLASTRASGMPANQKSPTFQGHRPNIPAKRTAELEKMKQMSL
jgi:hypothetical protein